MSTKSILTMLLQGSVVCAQVANQQGRYLASVFNQHRVGPQADAAADNGLPAVVPHFQYRHLGSFAYVGADKAVLELAMQGEGWNACCSVQLSNIEMCTSHATRVALVIVL